MPIVIPSMRPGGPGFFSRGTTERSRWMSKTNRVGSIFVMQLMIPILTDHDPGPEHPGTESVHVAALEVRETARS
jgi:hypothetical protein